MTRPNFALVPLEHTTQFAPLVALGFYLRECDLLAPLWSRLTFTLPTHVAQPGAALLDLWISLLAGCSSVSQINTRLRPDRLLAQAWGRSHFHEQSSIARILDTCHPEQVAQMRQGSEVLYRWIGAAPRTGLTQPPLILDVDLTGLPAGRHAEGSTKGYFSGKRGPPVVSYVGSGPSTTTRVSCPSSIRGTR